MSGQDTDLKAQQPGYGEATYNAKSALKRWVHNKRFVDALRIIDITPRDTVLDYGCGDGHLLRMALGQMSPDRMCGFEPAENMFVQARDNLAGTGIMLTSDAGDLKGKKFTKISCLEVCEHLPDTELTELLAVLSGLLADDGIAVISVPVETGIPALLKNSFRYVKYRTYSNLTLASYFTTLFGMRTERGREERMAGVNYIYSHVGFDHRQFEKLLARYFTILSRHGSPLPALGTFLNNAVYYRCRKS